MWSITFLHSFIIFTLNIFINSLSNNDSNSITIHFMGPQPLLVVSTTGSMTLFTVNLLCRSCFFGSCSYCMNRQFAVNILTMFLPEWNGWNNVFNMVFWDYKRFGFCLKISFWYCQWLKFRVFFSFNCCPVNFRLTLWRNCYIGFLDVCVVFQYEFLAESVVVLFSNQNWSWVSMIYE